MIRRPYIPPPLDPWRVDHIGAAFLKAVVLFACLGAFGAGLPLLLGLLLRAA